MVIFLESDPTQLKLDPQDPWALYRYRTSIKASWSIILTLTKRKMVSPSWRSKLKEIYPSGKEWSQGQSLGNRYYLMQHEGGPHERFKITMNKNPLNIYSWWFWTTSKKGNSSFGSVQIKVKIFLWNWLVILVSCNSLTNFAFCKNQFCWY